MKQIFSILLSLTIFNVWGQTTSTGTPLPELTGLAFYVTGGVKPLRTNQSTLYFAYVDESPSRDNITEEFDMPSSMYSASLRLGGEYEFPTPFFVKLQLEGYLAKIYGYSIDGGIGYAIKNKKKTFSVRPQLLVSSGMTILNLGNIYQNDLYIEVNGTQFYSNSVSTSLRSRYLLLTPQLEFGAKVSDNLELRFSAELPLPISKGDPYVYFSGADKTNNQVDATESITVPNMNLYLNNEPLRSQNINFTFPGFHVGIAYKL